MKRNRVVGMAALLLTCALVAGLSGSGCGGRGGPSTRLDGAGSTFIDPLMQEWAGLYNKEKGVQVNYQAKGSGSGISMMTAREVDFGCSDAPLNEEQLAKAEKEGGKVLHVPLCLGAIVPAYNLPGVEDLVLSGPVLMDIYRGKITTWNDPKIRKINPGKKLPSDEIGVAFRSDSSGSTYILTDYFMKIDAERVEKGEKKAWTPGRGTAIKFPKGTGAKGTAGVAQYVKQNRGAIGYVELTYAAKQKIPYARVINSSGEAIKAGPRSTTAAAATAEIPDDLRYSITNAPGKDAYPLAGTTWALVYVKLPAEKVQPVKDFLHWATHEGQKENEKLDYAPLPESLVKKIEAKLNQIEAGK